MAPRLKFYGWGREGEGLTDEERARVFRFAAERLGVRAPARGAALARRDHAAPPRIAAPASLATVLTQDPHERLLHTYGKCFPRPSVPCSATSRMRRIWSPCPRPRRCRGRARLGRQRGSPSSPSAAVPRWSAASSRVGRTVRRHGQPRPAPAGRVLEVDATSRAARIQAGILGPAIEAALKRHGLASATIRKASNSRPSAAGSRRARGPLRHALHAYRRFRRKHPHRDARGHDGVPAPARSGAGPSPDRMMIGSEGALGVITEAWMRLQARPRFRGGAVFGFPDLFAAARAVRAVAQAGLYPSNLRVIDNDEAGTYGVNDYAESLLILGFESADHPVDAWMSRAVELIQDNGGRRHDDEGAALRWRTAFIRMPYARELTVPLGVINDTFETAITWDRFEAFHTAIRSATEAALREATGRRGTVSTRFTHVYPDGPAPTTRSTSAGRRADSSRSGGISRPSASDAIIAAGGTITHHHAVGRDHMNWYRQQRPALFGKALEAAKSRARPGRHPQPRRARPLSGRSGPRHPSDSSASPVLDCWPGRSPATPPRGRRPSPRSLRQIRSRTRRRPVRRCCA